MNKKAIRLVIVLVITIALTVLVTMYLTDNSNNRTINARVIDSDDEYIVLVDEQGEQWIMDNSITVHYNTNGTVDIYDDEIIDISMQ